MKVRKEKPIRLSSRRHTNVPDLREVIAEVVQQMIAPLDAAVHQLVGRIPVSRYREPSEYFKLPEGVSVRIEEQSMVDQQVRTGSDAARLNEAQGFSATGRGQGPDREPTLVECHSRAGALLKELETVREVAGVLAGALGVPPVPVPGPQTTGGGIGLPGAIMHLLGKMQHELDAVHVLVVRSRQQIGVD